ncbi:MAG TPA: hypothetical protein PLW50_00310 [Smithellaceae bacterium]|nr:hypothetical protein [Smithellaceae bacterium]
MRQKTEYRVVKVEPPQANAGLASGVLSMYIIHWQAYHGCKKFGEVYKEYVSREEYKLRKAIGTLENKFKVPRNFIENFIHLVLDKDAVDREMYIGEEE